MVHIIHALLSLPIHIIFKLINPLSNVSLAREVEDKRTGDNGKYNPDLPNRNLRVNEVITILRRVSLWHFSLSI
jgi:hypothetical protein